MLTRKQEFCGECTGTPSRPRLRERRRRRAEGIRSIGIHEQVTQCAGQLESPAPRRRGARGPVDDGGRTGSSAGSGQHSLLRAYDARVNDFDPKLLHPFIHVPDRLSVQAETAANLLGGKPSRLLGAGAGRRCVARRRPQLFGEARHSPGLRVQPPDFAAHGFRRRWGKVSHDLSDDAFTWIVGTFGIPRFRRRSASVLVAVQPRRTSASTPVKARSRSWKSASASCRGSVRFAHEKTLSRSSLRSHAAMKATNSANTASPSSHRTDSWPDSEMNRGVRDPANLAGIHSMNSRSPARNSETLGSWAPSAPAAKKCRSTTARGRRTTRPRRIAREGARFPRLAACRVSKREAEKGRGVPRTG